MYTETINAVPLLRFSSFRDMPVTAAHTTRLGGVSEGPYASLNIGFRDNEPAGNVRENRRLVAQALQMDPQKITAAQQCHSANIAVVNKSDAGRGALSWAQGYDNTDGLATARPGIPLLVVSADCLLVALVSSDPPAIAAVHAGWRSVAGGILTNAVDTLATRFGARPERLRVALGPHISAQVYEVKEDMQQAFESSAGLSPECFTQVGGRMLFNLERAATRQLSASGVRPEAIETPGGQCTFSEAGRFYSHRRDGAATGRQGLIVMLK